METFRTKSIESDILNTRRELFHRKKFADVTLVSDELVKFPAHRTVLASASTIFDSLLEINTEQSPVLFLKGVSQNILEAILQFVYIGETSVRADQVAEFSEISKDLGISLSFNIQGVPKKMSFLGKIAITTLKFIQNANVKCKLQT